MSRIEGHVDSAARGELVGRADELREVARFLDAASAEPRALVLRGEPGIGKTTLWRAGVEAARKREYRVLVCRPAEAEAKLGYVALVDLLETVPDGVVEALDEPQRRALDVALLRSAPNGSRADPRAVALALLNVLRSLASFETVIIAIDDLQWLDTASVRALEFAVRRLDREPIGILASQRIGDPAPAFDRALDDWVKRLTVAPLGRDDIDGLLREGSEVPPSRHTTSRIHRLSGGNPFFALEIARSLEGQDESFVDDHLSVPPTLRALVGRRIAALPQSTRHALLAASSLAAPTISTIAAATGRRDGHVPALAEAEAAGVVEIDFGVVRFTHPLLGSTVYSEASHDERRRLHRRLADVVVQPEESARHLALAVDGPDAAVADALDAAAASARTRGAPDDAVTFAELAWRLTPVEASDDRQRRQVAAIGYHLFAGDTRRARQLAEDATAALPPGDVHARALLQLGALTPNTHAGRRLLRRALGEARDAALLCMIESSLVASYMTDFRAGDASAHAVAALEHATRADDPGLRASTLMDVAWSRFYLEGGMSPGLVREALELERFCDPTPVRRLPKMRHTLMLHLTDQLGAARSSYGALAERARAYGDEPSLSRILALLSEVECFAGRFGVALDRAKEAHDIAVRCESERNRSGALLRVAMAHAHLGDVDAARAAGAEAKELMRRNEDLHSLGASAMVLTFLELSRGNPRVAIEEALPFATSLVECDVVAPGPTFGFIPDLIEALVAVGELDQASFYLQALESRAKASGNVWARATESRSRALVEAARDRHDEAIAATDAALQLQELVARPLERGRTLLVRGVVQRRSKQRRGARNSLTQSVEIFDALGARLWAERARVELSRIGGRATVDELTPTEAQVAARAAAGETNREIADALFMSVKTVEANLSRVYRKLDVSSRRQLGPRLERQT